MDVIEEFLYSISYKFPKGYPDINDPKDNELLYSLVEDILSTPDKDSKKNK